MLLKDLSAWLILICGEPNLIFPLSLENDIDRPIAQFADTIEYDHRMIHGHKIKELNGVTVLNLQGLSILT